MDARVNAFLNEINEIAPLNDKNDCVWEKCYDDDSGYYYYWNTKTNEVTWDMPAEYKSKQQQTQKKKPVSLYMPPRTAPLFPSTSSLIPPVSDAIKIYKIGQHTDTVVTNITTNNCTTTVGKVHNVEKANIKQKEEDKVEINTKLLKNNNSIDTKVALITSYGDDSDSENEDTKTPNSSVATTTTQSDCENLTKLQESNDINETTTTKKVKDEISGFALVAGYGSDDDNDDDNSINNEQTSETKEIAHSTLFPITKPINIKDFEETEQSNDTRNDNDFDTKAFQRKRRIGVALVNTTKKTKINDNLENFERKGLGFTNDEISTSATTTNSKYPGFTCGGVLFSKTDEITNNNDNKDNDDDTKDIEDSYATLKEKLGFLSEGREEVSPVQTMLIQLETLYTALKTGDLKHKYLRKWLDDTCGDLIKLEKETTPEGWLLQWDRYHKRYYYQNESTGESQWEYPQSDVTRCDEAMDISTTPPPTNHEQNVESSPVPAKVSSPTPAVINDKKSTKLDVGDLSENNSRDSVDVDVATQKSKVSDDLSEALNSFYSDIAAIETSNSPPPVTVANEENKLESTDVLSDVSKKKKKSKVKLVQGIAMKKKGVSKLVEKWKNVQLSYSD